MPACNKPPARYATPANSRYAPHCTELIVRRSRFETRTFQAASAAQARKGVAWIGSQHADATHNCWAYVAGAPGSTADIGCSDDGEPHGTAGKPMLNVLLHSNIGQICVVVSRWFGGIKLGTGGLARAYQDAVLGNLPTLELVERVPVTSWLLQMDYSQIEGLRKFLPQVQSALVNETYGARVELVIAVPCDREAQFLAGVAQLTYGTVTPRKMEAPDRDP